jgi:hypothetical protein
LFCLAREGLALRAEAGPGEDGPWPGPKPSARLHQAPSWTSTQWRGVNLSGSGATGKGNTSSRTSM